MQPLVALRASPPLFLGAARGTGGHYSPAPVPLIIRISDAEM